ncbi:MAG: methyl-accepting chemotaxis protein [Halohasta sp.]
MGGFEIRERYGAKLALSLLVITVLVGGVGVAIYATVDGELTDSTEAQLESRAASDAAQVDNWQRLTNQQFVSVMRSTPVRSGDDLGTHSQLTRVSTQREIVGASLVNSSASAVAVQAGQVEIDDSDGHLRPSVAEQVQRLADQPNGRTSYSDPFRLDGERPVVLAVTTPPSGDDRVLVSVVDLSKLSFELFGTDTERDQTSAVVNDTGTVVLSSNQSALLAEAPMAGGGVGDDTGTTTAMAGQQLAVGYAATGANGWTMTTQVPTDAAYGLRDTVSKQILLLLGVLVAGLGGIGLTIGRNTVRSVTDLAARANGLRDGDLETSIESDRRDEFGDVYRALDSMRCSLREEIAEAEAAHQQAEAERQRAQVARKEAEALNERLESTAAAFGETMDACAEGDLTQRLSTDTDSDAMAEIATAFNAMVDEWAETIQRVRQFGDAVEAETAAVADSVDSTHHTSKTLADGMATIAEESTRQASSLRTVREETESLSATVEEASSAAAEVATAADEVLDNGAAGREAARAAQDELDDIEHRTTAAAEQVDQLAALVDDIEDVTELITEIADQTNILALNAAIEAARADSDGFGAVATEVKSLAEETQAATADIESTIAELKTQTDETAAEMDHTRGKVDDGAETIDEALAAFDTIVDDIEETATGIAEIDRAVSQQADSTQAVMSELIEVSEVSTETANAADAAASDATEQAERMETVTESVDRLSAQALQLAELLGTFETETVATGSEVETVEDHPTRSASASAWSGRTGGAAATDGGSET